MRRPWRTTAGGWHTETHDPHAHHHHDSSDRLFSGFSYEAIVQHVTDVVTGFCRVCGVLYPSWGTTPRNFQFSSTGVVAQSCAATCQITRKDGAIIDILCGGFWFDRPCFTACPRVVTLTALQTAGTFVCAHDCRAVRTVKAAQPL